MRLAIFTLVGMLAASPAFAGAWPQPEGETQVIVKYQAGASDQVFDGQGVQTTAFRRQEDELSLHIDRGLTDAFTLHMQFSAVRDREALLSDGKGPMEMGLRFGHARNGTALSVYAGAAYTQGYGRQPAQRDYEARLLFGQSGEWRGKPIFAEIQGARVVRTSLPDQVRLDTTVGITPRPGTQLFFQTYSGRADNGSAAWLKSETSVVFQRGAARYQLGWRQSVWGRQTRVESGPTFALWRRF